MREKYITALALVLSGCAPAPNQPRRAVEHDPTTEAWYATATAELAAADRQAEALFRSGKQDAASALIEQGETVSARLLAVPRPTLTATVAAADLDDLYGRMLFHNRHYGWARLQFQKNVARWKRWKPQTPDSARRLETANQQIRDCDREIEK